MMLSYSLKRSNIHMDDLEIRKTRGKNVSVFTLSLLVYCSLSGGKEKLCRSPPCSHTTHATFFNSSPCSANMYTPQGSDSRLLFFSPSLCSVIAHDTHIGAHITSPQILSLQLQPYATIPSISQKWWLWYFSTTLTMFKTNKAHLISLFQ